MKKPSLRSNSSSSRHLPLYLLILSILSTSLFTYAKPSIKLTTEKIRPETGIEINFDHAMVAQNKVNKIFPNNILKITPTWKGQIRWSTTNTLEFLPTTSPKINTNYTFSLNKGLKHLDGKAIGDTSFGAIKSEPFDSDYSRTFQSLRQNRQLATYLRFNDDVSPANTSKFIIYKNSEGDEIKSNARQALWSDLESSYYVKPNWNKRFQNILLLRDGKKISKPTYKKNETIRNGLIITPAEPLTTGKDWKLIIKQALPNSSKQQKTISVDTVHIGSLLPLSASSISPASAADEARRIYISFNSSLPEKMTHEQIASFISILPAPADLKFERSSSSTVKATGSFYDHDNYTLTVKKGFTASNGLSMNEDQLENINFKYIAPSVGLPSFALSQLANGQRKYSIDSVNMETLEVKVKQLNLKQAIRVYQGYKQYSAVSNKDDNNALPYSLISGSTVYDQEIKLDNPIDTSKEVHFNWDEILPNKDKHAVVFLSVEATPKQKIGEQDRKASRKIITQSIVQITDIGLAWKIANDKVWIYAYSCQTGKPLDRVTISLYGKDAKQLINAKTDSFGLCEIQRIKSDETHIVASLGKDVFITALDRSTSKVAMWRFPITYNSHETNYWDRDAMLFSDRSLYKPGETVRVKGILRETLDNTLRLPNDREVKYSMKDNRHREVTSGNLKISTNGSFDLVYKLPAEKVGRHHITFTFNNHPDNKDTGEQDRRNNSFSHSFNVQEFRRNAFEITSHLPTPEPAADTAQIDLNAQYYQGTPIAEGKLKWYFSATPTGFYPAKFRDFLFGDHRKHDPYYWSHYFGYNDGSSYNRDTEHLNGNALLSADGAASVKVDIPKPEFPSPQRISFESEITDSRNQTLTNTTNTLVHPAHHYYGISRVDQLVRVEDQIELQLVHIDLKGNYSQLNTTASLKIQREYYETVKIVDNNGKESVKNEKRLEDISNTKLDITGDKPNTLPFSATKPGRYILTLRDTDSDSATASAFYVYGKEDFPWATEDGIRIKLVSEKKSYKPGDTARILVMTPIEGTALVTVERQGVMRHFKRELKIDNPVIEVPLDANDAPNTFVSVLIIRGADDSKREAKEPALKLGICEIKVFDKTKKLNVALNVQGDYHRPGEEITVTGTITDHTGAPVPNAEVTLYAEDEGVLAVMGYQLPKPLDHFHRSRALTLKTGVSLGYFISENPHNRYYGNKGFVIGDAKGFGDVEMAIQEEVNMTLRKNFDPCAFWMPNITTLADGTFTITSKTPDTLTRYRIMAVASSGADLYGSEKSSVVVSKDIMLEPAAPRFAHEGDQLTPKVLVQNTSKFSGQWNVSLTTGDLTQMKQNSSNQFTQTISLAAGESVTLEFPVAISGTGEARWIWTATPNSINGSELTSVLSNRLSDSMESKFKVRYPRPLLKHMESIAMLNDRKELFSAVDERLMNGRGKAKLKFSNSLLLEASGAFDHLLKYPYGCLEQTTSSMMPWFAVKDLRHIMPESQAKSDEEILDAIQKGVDRILSMQVQSGGLAYWPGNDKAEQWATSYGAMGLIMAQQAGAKVPTSSFNQLISYLKESTKKINIEKESSWNNESNCRSLYILAMAKSIEPSVLNVFYEKRKMLSKNARAYLALAIHHIGGDKIKSLELLNDNSNIQIKDHWMTNRSDKAIALIAWTQIDPQNPKVDQTLKAIIKSKNNQGHWRTTWVNGWTLNAMASYARNVETQRKDITISIYGQGSNNSKEIILTKENPTHSINLTLDQAQQIIASSNGKAYVKIYVEAKPEIAPAGAESHKGLNITRSYQRLNEKSETEPLTDPRVGDLVQVNLTVTFPKSLSYVAIDDPLPSIMETVNNGFATQKSHIADPSRNNRHISRRELRSDRALFFLNRSWSNEPQTISYLARITSEGAVHTPPAKVEAMYDPSMYALTEASMITSEK